MPIYRISEAARLLGVSDDTIRRWVDTGRLPLSPKVSGPNAIDGKVLAEFVLSNSTSLDVAQNSHVSARNRFTGIVTKVEIDGLVAQIEIHAGPHRIVSLITADAARELSLEVGCTATASIKATNVVVESP